MKLRLDFLRKKNFLIISGLVVVLLILSGIAAWDEWKTKQEQKEAATKNKLFNLNPEEISGIRYIDKGAEIVLTKRDGSWVVEKPLNASADDRTINSLIDVVKDYKYEKVVASGKETWKNYGLDPAARSIVFLAPVNGKHSATTLFIGDKSPVGYSVYSSLDGESNPKAEVFIGTQYLLVSTTKSLFDFRDKKLVGIDEKSLVGLQYESKDAGMIEIARKEGKFSILQPKPVATDTLAVQDFIDRLNGIKVSEFMDHPSPEMKALFSDPKASEGVTKVAWTNDKGVTAVARFVEHQGNLFGALNPDGPIMKLPDESKAFIKKTVFDFQDRRIFGFDAKDVGQVEIDNLKFKKVKDGWYSSEDAAKLEGANPEVKVAQKNHVQALIVDLEYAKAEKVLDAAAPEISKLPEDPLHSPPLHRIRLEFLPKEGKGTDPVTVDVWPKKDDQNRMYLRKSQGNQIFEVPKMIVANLTELPPPVGPVEGQIPPDMQDGEKETQ